MFTLSSIVPSFGLALSQEQELSPRASNGTANRIVDCMNPETHPGIEPTSLSDCNSALFQIVRQPGFRDKWWFSRNWRFGIKVPKQWKHGDCTIFVSCGNDYDRDRFTYRDVAAAAKRIITECIEEQPETHYGGLEVVGQIGSFYVAVGRQRENPAVRLGHSNSSEAATA